MPISLRLPDKIESEIAGFGARHGLSKSAVIVRSIQEFLARNAQPTSAQIYDEVMRDALNPAQRAAQDDEWREAAESRPHKLQARAAIGQKHALRSARSVKRTKQSPSLAGRVAKPLKPA
ncbi:MAG: hypothetical protein ABIN37_11420 [Burkholderiaceae bacterium]